MRTLIYVPAWNTAHVICKTLDRIPQDYRSCDVLVIDNASTDGTSEVVKEYSEKHPEMQIELITNKINLGYGGSQKQAYAYAVYNKYDYVHMHHSDGQYPVEKIGEVAKVFEDFPDTSMVYGSRISGGKALEGGMPIWRFLGNKGLTWIENKILGTNLTEFHSGFRAYKVSDLAKLNVQGCVSDYYFDTDIIILLVDAKMKIREIPIPTHYGKESRSPSVWTTFKYSVGVLKAVIVYKLRGKKN